MEGRVRNWSDAANWTASDASVGYPNDDTDHDVVFPPDVTSVVTVDSATVSCRYLGLFAGNSDVTITSAAGCTNSVIYRQVRLYDAGTGTYTAVAGANAKLTLDAVKVLLKTGNSAPGRLFTASTANNTDCNVRKLPSGTIGADAELTLRNGAYFSVLQIDFGARMKLKISSEAELHAAVLTMTSTSEIELDNGYLTPWYFYSGGHAFDPCAKMVLRGDHPRMIFGRSPSGYEFFGRQWNSKAGANKPNTMIVDLYLPAAPYVYAPFGNNGTDTKNFPGGSVGFSDSGEVNFSFGENTVKINLMPESPAMGEDFTGKREYMLFDVRGLSWKKRPKGLVGTEYLQYSGKRFETFVGPDVATTNYTDTYTGDYPQYCGVNLLPKKGLIVIFR